VKCNECSGLIVLQFITSDKVDFVRELLMNITVLLNSSLFNEFMCTSGFFSMSRPVSNVLKAHECHKEPNLQTNELNTTFFFVRRVP
jgi:hypothetical protein